jgi:adenylate cyclase
MSPRGPRRSRRTADSEFDRALEEKIERDMMAALQPKRQLPEGIVSIVFTDIVESTALVYQLGEAAAHGVLRRHDEAVRATLKDHGGIEVERNGDGFMLAFTLASRAVAFGVAVHRAVADASTDPPLELRVGIDTGEVMAEEKGYFGTTVFRAARIEGVAKPGTTLVSEPTKLIAERASIPFEFASVGAFDLKGLPGEHELFEVTPATPASLHPAD